MKKLREYKDEVINFTVPYVKQASNYAGAAAETINQKYKKSRRKINRNILKLKCRRVLRVISNIAGLAAAVLVIITMIRLWISEYTD